MLVIFVAVMIRNLQDQRMTEPALIALAVLGFVGYGVLGSIGWVASKRIELRLGRSGRLAVYFSAMSLTFLLATCIYLILEFSISKRLRRRFIHRVG